MNAHQRESERFHAWELRGRGWTVFPEPVLPEPPFVPFPGHRVPITPAVDDGRRPTFLSSLVQKLGQKMRTEPLSTPAQQEPEEEPEPTLLIRDPLTELQTSLPANLDISREAFGHFLSNLSLCREPVTMELLGVPRRVTLSFVAHPEDSHLVRRQLQAHFPEGTFHTKQGTLQAAWDECEGEEALVVEFGLEREFMYPLQTGKLESFVGIIGALAELEKGELGLFQVIFQPVSEKWAENIISSVTHEDGRPFFVNQPELTSAAKAKVARPLFAAVVRIALRSRSFDSALELARNLAGSLRVFANPSGNELIPVENDGYQTEDHIEDTLCRQSRRSGMILNSEELLGFVHLPSSAVRSPVLVRDTGKTKVPPAIVRGERGTLLGNNVHLEESVPVRLAPDQRVRHCHIIGVHGTGKSTLLFNLIRQDIENGEGLAVLDPHGDLIEQVLGVIPANRIEDVVLVDPSDEQYSVGFNILSAHSDLEKNLLASDLVSVFQRLSSSWGDQLNSVLQNAILAFLESDQGGTLADVQRFLLEPTFRDRFLYTVRDPAVAYYWRKGFVQLSGNKSIGPVITRLGTFLAPKQIRYMVSQKVNRLDFADILDSGKIFLARLPQGQMGKENAFLLGSLLVSKFQQLAMSRQAQKASARRDFWLYIDEFQNFITPSMTEILTGARKYRLGLILAHQELRQLERDREVASAVLSNPYARVVFRVGDSDARALESGFSFFKARDLQNLETGQAICRVEKADFDFNLSIPLPKAADAATTDCRKEAVVASSRQKYGTLRSQVEALLAKQLGVAEPPSSEVNPIPSQIKPAEPVLLEPTVSKEVRVDGPQETKPQLARSEEDDAKNKREHEDIKDQIKREAEHLEYTAHSEIKAYDGKKQIDVVLERGQRKIACEISVTNTVEYEAATNLTKCLNSGFTNIVSVCSDRRKLERIRKRFAEIANPDQLLTVGFNTPDELLSLLFDWASSDPAGGEIERSKPRKRDIALRSQISEAERKERERQMLAHLRRKLKGGK